MAVDYERIVDVLQKELQQSKLDNVVGQLPERVSWNDGRSLGEVGCLLLPTIVRDLCNAFEEDERHCENAFDGARKTASMFFENATQSLSDERDAQLKKAEDEYQESVRRADNEVHELREQIERCDHDINLENARFTKMGYFEKRNTRKRHESTLEKLAEKSEETKRLLSAKYDERRQLDEIRDRTIRETIEPAFEQGTARLNREYREAKDCINQLCKDRITQNRENLRNALASLVDHEQLQQLRSLCASIRPSYERFQTLRTETFERPGEFHMGTVVDKYIVNEAEQRVAGLDEEVYEIVRQPQGADDLRIFLPFVIDLSKGLQVIIRSESAERSWINESIRLLTIRLLMAYPPAKLQLTLIDPLRNGLSFADVTRIADRDHEYLIGGGALTQSKFIEQGLNALLLKMSGFSQSYGRDREAYFRREAIQAVIINDFPNGFTKSSLEDLAKIMKNGRDFGTIFIIGVNDAYVGDFEKDSNFRAIMSEINVYQNDFMLVGDKSPLKFKDVPVALELGDEQLVLQNEEHILGELRRGIQHSSSRKESFDQLFEDLHDPNTWLRESSIDGVDIPIGVEGASNVVTISIGRPGTAHHGLITGATGSGKSTALHAMIMSTILNYSAEEVRFALIDFKEGTEFRDYALCENPSFLSVTTTTEPEYALAALKELEDEFETRAAVYDHGDIQEYRTRHPETDAPRIILLFDEVQALFADDVREDIRNACLAILRKLVTQGRSVGLHVFLASQNFDRVPSLRPLMSDMQVRLCIKDADTGGILESAEALRDAPVGSAILNNHGGSLDAGQTLFQVCYLEEDEQYELLEELDAIYAGESMRERYRDYETKLLFTNIMDNRFHPFNRLIEEDVLERPGRTALLHLGCSLKLIGGENPYSVTGSDFQVPIGGNLLMVGNNPDIATSLFISTAISEAMAMLADDGAVEGIDLFDFTEADMFVAMAAGRSTARHATLADLAAIIPDAVTHVETASDFGDAPYLQRIDELYELLQERKTASKGGTKSWPRRLLLLYGIDSAIELVSADTLGGASFGELGTLPKLQAILKEGPRHGIQTVAWGQSLKSVETVLNSNSQGPAKGYFGYRVIFSASPEEFSELGMCTELPATRQGAYFFSQRGRMYFRPFDPPSPNWVQQFGDAFVDRWAMRR